MGKIDVTQEGKVEYSQSIDKLTEFAFYKEVRQDNAHTKHNFLHVLAVIPLKLHLIALLNSDYGQKMASEKDMRGLFFKDYLQMPTDRRCNIVMDTISIEAREKFRANWTGGERIDIDEIIREVREKHPEFSLLLNSHDVEGSMLVAQNESSGMAVNAGPVPDNQDQQDSGRIGNRNNIKGVVALTLVASTIAESSAMLLAVSAVFISAISGALMLCMGMASIVTGTAYISNNASARNPRTTVA